MTDNPVNRVFRLILGLTYIVMGVFLYIKQVVPAPWGLVLGIAFAVYGSWRIYRTYQVRRDDEI
jgi:hypothetical protein